MAAPLAPSESGYFHVSTPPSWTPAMAKLMMQPASHTLIVPNLYLKAANEALSLALIICWILTLLFKPATIRENQLQSYVGFNNVCVGWDFAPANYFGLLGTVMNAHFAWQYAGYDAMRTELRDQDGKMNSREAFYVCTDYLFAVSATVLVRARARRVRARAHRSRLTPPPPPRAQPLVFLVGPPDEAWLSHTVVFIQFIVAKYFVVLANFLESDPARRTRASKVFIVVYGAVSLLMPIGLLLDILVYEAQDRTGADPPIPWPIVMILDYGWMACQVGVTRLLPQDAPIRCTRVLLALDTRHELGSHEHAELKLLGVHANPSASTGNGDAQHTFACRPP